jgi:hypothetical protein
VSPVFVARPSRTSRSDLAPHIAGLFFRTPLLAGEAGTAQTVKKMRELVDQAVSDPSFVRQAIEIVRGIPAYNDVAEASTVYEWVKRNVRYTKDPVTKEKLYPPRELLKIRAGDCDDISMLMGGLGIALGYPARLITIAANPENPEEFSHVYTELEVPPGSGQWIAMDAARHDAQFGVEPLMYFRKKAWSLTDSSSQELHGCGCEKCSVGAIGCSGLGGYATVSGYAELGQTDYSGLVSQAIQEIPQIIAVETQQPSHVQTPQGTVATGSPYASFVTPYTPGYGIPQAGYGTGLQVQSTGSIWPWVIGIGLILFASGRGRR